MFPTMRNLYAFWAFLNIAIFIYAGLGLGNSLPGNGDNLNITKILDTDEILWLYLETIQTGPHPCPGPYCFTRTETCICNIKNDLSDKYYNFTQAMESGGHETSHRYVGLFVNDTKPPKSMNVTEIQGNWGQESYLYTLQYTDEYTYNCSVFFVSPLKNLLSFEQQALPIYIKNNSVKEGPSSGCKTFFEERCKEKGTQYQPYSNECKPPMYDKTGDEQNTNDIH
uniref:Putative secreted protein n=1 Tax=Amblyomma americanum TaxID=6943 RepID=A0A0C9RY27_AMBAM